MARLLPDLDGQVLGERTERGGAATVGELRGAGRRGAGVQLL